MKTPVLVAAVVVIVVAALIVGVLSLNNDLTPNPNIEITRFYMTETSSSGSDYNVVQFWFVLNLTNTGKGDVKDLTVTFNTNTTQNHQQVVYTNSTHPNDKIAEFELGDPCQLGDLKANETKDFMFYWSYGFDSYASSLNATLKSNQEILDQATLTIPPRPHVEITNFVFTGIFHGTRLGGALDLFSLSYTNLGNTNVESLTITLNTSKTDKTNTMPTPNPGYNPKVFLDEYINGETYTLESLNTGETKTFEKTYFEWGAYDSVEPFVLTAILRINGTILDQATIMVPINY